MYCILTQDWKFLYHIVDFHFCARKQFISIVWMNELNAVCPSQVNSGIVSMGTCTKRFCNEILHSIFFYIALQTILIFNSLHSLCERALESLCLGDGHDWGFFSRLQGKSSLVISFYSTLYHGECNSPFFLWSFIVN